MSGARTGATCLLALSLFSLAGALVYFTVEVARVGRQIPDLLSGVERAGREIDPVVREMTATRKQIPAVLEEARLIREQIPPILKQIPPIIEEVRATREQLPRVLESVDRASAAVTLAAGEVAATRPLIPGMLDEMKKTREAVPPLLDRAAQVIGQARQEATQRTVTGAITGIITAPFAIIGNIGRKLVGSGSKGADEYNERDVELLNRTVGEVLPSAEIDASQTWSNPESGTSGKVTLLSIGGEGNAACRTLRVQTFKKDASLLDRNITLCLKNGTWVEVR